MAAATFSALWSHSVPVGGGVRSRSGARLILKPQVRAEAAPMATEKLGVKVERDPSESILSELGVRNWPKWGCPPSKFPWTYTDRETCYLLQGKVKVYPDGHDDYVEIGAGDLVVFPKGMKCTWDVSQTVDKHYYFGSPEILFLGLSERESIWLKHVPKVKLNKDIKELLWWDGLGREL